MELEAIHPFGDFYLQAGYTLLSTRDLSTPAELQLENVPEHELSAWLTWRPDGPTGDSRPASGPTTPAPVST